VSHLRLRAKALCGSAPLSRSNIGFFDFSTYHHWNQAFLFEVKQVLDMLQQRLGISSNTTTPFASVFTLPTLATNGLRSASPSHPR